MQGFSFPSHGTGYSILDSPAWRLQIVSHGNPYLMLAFDSPWAVRRSRYLRSVLTRAVLLVVNMRDTGQRPNGVAGYESALVHIQMLPRTVHAEVPIFNGEVGMA